MFFLRLERGLAARFGLVEAGAVFGFEFGLVGLGRTGSQVHRQLSSLVLA